MPTVPQDNDQYQDPDSGVWRCSTCDAAIPGAGHCPYCADQSQYDFMDLEEQLDFGD